MISVESVTIYTTTFTSEQSAVDLVAPSLRRIVSGRQYKCRNPSNGKCPIEKGMTKFCKKCRYEKCLEVGMDPNLVQLHRDKIGARKDSLSNNSPTKVKTESSFDYEEEPHSSTSNQSPYNFCENKTKKRHSSEPSLYDTRKYSPNYDGLTFEMDMKIRIQSPPQQIMLERLNQGYKDYKKAQKNLFSMLYPSKTVVHEPKKIKYSEYFRMKRGSYSLIFSMLNDSFQPFDQLNHDVKKSSLKSFSELFCFLDEAFRTTIEFPNAGDTRISCNYGQYIDQEDLKYFYQETEMMTTKIKLAETAFKHFRYLINKMKDLEVREIEVTALTSVILWTEVALIDNSANAQQVQEQIYSELHSNIVSCYGAEKVGIRMGSLMSFLHDINNLATLFKEILTLTKIFDPNLIKSYL